MTEDVKRFRTKTGYCEITPESIALVRSGWRGAFAKLLFPDDSPSVFDRESITRVEAHPPVTGATRGYFWIHYRRNERDRKRIVILPGIFGGGGREYEKARLLLESEGLLGKDH